MFGPRDEYNRPWDKPAHPIRYVDAHGRVIRFRSLNERNLGRWLDHRNVWPWHYEPPSLEVSDYEGWYQVDFLLEGQPIPPELVDGGDTIADVLIELTAGLDEDDAKARLHQLSILSRSDPEAYLALVYPYAWDRDPMAFAFAAWWQGERWMPNPMGEMPPTDVPIIERAIDHVTPRLTPPDGPGTIPEPAVWELPWDTTEGEGDGYVA